MDDQIRRSDVGVQARAAVVAHNPIVETASNVPIAVLEDALKLARLHQDATQPRREIESRQRAVDKAKAQLAAAEGELAAEIERQASAEAAQEGNG